MDYLRVADDAKFHPLTYEGSKIESQNTDFVLSNTGCFICQRNFESSELLEEHVEWHGDESDFESLKDFQKLDKPFFNLSYTICKCSHYFCFVLDTDARDVIIEKIIIVRSNSFYYVNKNEYDLNLVGSDKFFVDSHLFTSDVIQPIVIVFRYKLTDTVRFVEQHHFWRTEEFPLINFSIKANRLPLKATFKPTIDLAQYMPPQEIIHALSSTFICEDLRKISNELRDYVYNGKELTMSNICDVLNILLQIEDVDIFKKYETLVQHDAVFRKHDNEYSVKLKNRGRNIIESILTPCDEVIIIPNAVAAQSYIAGKLLDLMFDNTEDLRRRFQTVHFGIVERVCNDRVTFKCNAKINEDHVYKMIFRPSRLTLRYQYRALEYLGSLSAPEKIRVLFPVSGGNKLIPRLSLELYNSTISQNPEQYQAVQNITEGPTKNATYIIFGPPGTGKTTTVVEAILQLYKCRPYTKILVTAGSNSACDEVALRLCKVLTKLDDNRAIVRIFAKSNEKRLDNIDEDLLEASNMYGTHFYPDINLLHEYRIVVCTLSIVGKLSTGRFGRDILGDGVYTHIFVDEVAASTEAETLVGISSALSAKVHVIISGDHKQLGPILQSDYARDLGLGVSLMDRLLKRDCYKVDDYGNYDRTIQTRLIRNYRSHHQIVELYNELYYNGELFSMAKEVDVNLAKTWHSLPNPEFPIIFHSVFGNCIHDRSSTSLQNAKELDVVMDYVKDLMCFGINGQKIEQSDIGIISPYKKQYLLIQDMLNLRNLYGIETGSVETFQGKEKHIIIVSFVRSFTSSIGFLENPRRLNVTLSRAKSLLILIGNPKTLCLNDDYKCIIEKCRQNNTLVGTKIIDEIDITVDNNKSGNDFKKQSNRRPGRNNASYNNGNIKNDRLGKQKQIGIQSQRQKNQEKNFNKKKMDVDLLLQTLPDVPNESKQEFNKSVMQPQSNIYHSNTTADNANITGNIVSRSKETVGANSHAKSAFIFEVGAVEKGNNETSKKITNGIPFGRATANTKYNFSYTTPEREMDTQPLREAMSRTSIATPVNICRPRPTKNSVSESKHLDGGFVGNSTTTQHLTNAKPITSLGERSTTIEPMREFNTDIKPRIPIIRNITTVGSTTSNFNAPNRVSFYPNVNPVIRNTTRVGSAASTIKMPNRESCNPNVQPQISIQSTQFRTAVNSGGFSTASKAPITTTYCNAESMVEQLKRRAEADERQRRLAAYQANQNSETKKKSKCIIS